MALVKRSQAFMGLSISLAISASLALAATTHLVWLRASEPPEIKTLRAVLERLSRHNDLGHRPINFMVVSGPYAAAAAEERGFRKPDNCHFFAHLNPYRQYNNGWNELMRQAYAFGDIQAWTFSTGTIAIPQATFRAYGDHSGYVACTLAHEIAHFNRDHVFRESYHHNHNLNEADEAHKNVELMRYSREQELEADRDAAEMVARAGFPDRTCQHDISFSYRSTGDGSATTEDSTHPGYDDRLAAMTKHYDALEKQPMQTESGPAALMRYDRDANLLVVRPQRR
jgi:Zn-dependent protease with chaperone function